MATCDIDSGGISEKVNMKKKKAEGLGRTRSLDKSKGRLGRSWTETEMDYNPAEGYSRCQ